MSTINVIYGYKIFSYILIPKQYYYIPEISDIEFSIIMCSYYREFDENLRNNIMTMIINRINNTKNFYIYNVSPHSTTLCLNEIHMLDLDKINILINNESITEFSSFRTEQSDKMIKTFITKNIYKNQKITSDITINKINISYIFLLKNLINQQPINCILLVPYMFYIDDVAYQRMRSYNYSTLAFIKENKKIEHLSILFKINNTRNYNFENSNINKIEKYNIGNWRLYRDLIDLLTFMFNKKIIYDICFDYNLLKKYDSSIKKIYINSTLFEKKIEISKRLSIKTDLNMNIINSDIILNGKLSVNFDDKSILKHIFNKSILPLSENIGQVRILYDDFLTSLNLDVLELKRSYEIIFDSIIQRIRLLCQHKDFENKKFIIKDANGSQGIGISGFNCINYNSISKELKKLFIEKLFDNKFFTREINSILDTHLLVQEFISSPTINIPQYGNYKFKTRIYILLEQNPDLTVNFHLNKLINLDFMHNFNSDHFFNTDLSDRRDVDSHTNQFISNHLDDKLKFLNSTFLSDLTLLNFDYDLKLKSFLTNFAKQFSVILTKFKSLFIDLLGASINKKIFKVLTIDAIFDEHEDNNIKILEINTAGAIYEYFPNVYEYIIDGRLRNFHSIFSVNLDVISTSKKYLSNTIKVKINYD